MITDIFRTHVPEESVEEQWDIVGLEAALKAELNLDLPLKEWLEKDPDLHDETLLERVAEKAREAYAAKVPEGAEASFHQYERYVMLQILDGHWREHLAALDHLRQGIHLRGYAQMNPKQEYKKEAFSLFGAMLESVKLEVTKTLAVVEIRATEELAQVDDAQHVENVRMRHPSLDEVQLAADDEALASAAARKPQPMVRPTNKVGRNDPCPCGSGKKYKHCHGRLT